MASIFSRIGNAVNPKRLLQAAQPSLIGFSKFGQDNPEETAAILAGLTTGGASAAPGILGQAGLGAGLNFLQQRRQDELNQNIARAQSFANLQSAISPRGQQFQPVVDVPKAGLLERIGGAAQTGLTAFSALNAAKAGREARARKARIEEAQIKGLEQDNAVRQQGFMQKFGAGLAGNATDRTGALGNRVPVTTESFSSPTRTENLSVADAFTQAPPPQAVSQGLDAQVAQNRQQELINTLRGLQAEQVEQNIDLAPDQAALKAGQLDLALERKRFEFQQKLTAFQELMAGTGTAEPLTPVQVNSLESTLRDDFTKLVKPHAEVANAYSRILAVSKEPSAAGDLALIFNYMKMLDPDSTVRESEFATAEQAGSVPQAIWNQYNRMLKGERLGETRQDFLNKSKVLYESATSQMGSLATQFEGIAGRKNVDAQNIVLDFGIKDLDPNDITSRFQILPDVPSETLKDFDPEVLEIFNFIKANPGAVPGFN